ncbi:MAG: calcium-binding protein, partial [Acidimicrobiia bacterium]
SDNFGNSVTIKAGEGGYEPGVPAADLTLTWKTFSEAADEAGVSRQYGGYHFNQGDLDGRAMGRQVAGVAYARAQTYFDGTAVAAPTALDTLPRTL